MDYWPTDAKIIQIDADQKMLLVKKISVGIWCRCKAAAQALTKRLEKRDLKAIALARSVDTGR